MATSSIEWTQVTWNPVTGCSKISPGCKFCYAEVMSKRLQAMGISKYSEGFKKIKTHPESLTIPISWKKPKVVFVNSMSDLFHPEVSLDFIKSVFAVMNQTPQHIYQVLTKRSDRLLELSSQLEWTNNIWMGVSVENEECTFRVNDLSQTGAMIKFLSIEPLIGEVTTLNLKNIDWVIVGGESGHKARPIQKHWIDFVKEKCELEKIPFFFKQWGKPKFNVDQLDPTILAEHPQHAKGGCQLDGKVLREMPISVY